MSDEEKKTAAQIVKEQQVKAAAEATAAAEEAKKANQKAQEEAAKREAEERKKIQEAAAEGKKPKHTGKKIRVTTANPYKMHCPTQDITIYPDAITEVVDDRWIRGQLNEGTLLRK